jgi:hypothetical protein
MKKKCLKCGALATWIYMPIYHDYSYCDDCVPRGCSCNFTLTDDCSFLIIDGEFIEDLDDKGRKLPCCEYDFFEEGVEEDHKTKYPYS